MGDASPANARKPNAPAIWRTRRNLSFSPQRHCASHEHNAESSRTGRACEAVQIQRAALRIQGCALARMPDTRKPAIVRHAAEGSRLLADARYEQSVFQPGMRVLYRPVAQHP